MQFDFDAVIDRSQSDSNKWLKYGEDVIPMWVADMDFAVPQPVIDAIRTRIEHPVFGYTKPPDALREIVAERAKRLQKWSFAPSQVSFLPGLVCGLNVVCRAFGERGSGVLVNTPVYMPFLSAPAYQDRELHSAELAKTTVLENGQQRIRYEIDFDALEAAIQPNTRLFILCNPHNPVGRAYTAEELNQLAELCIKHDLILCSDEIHCELMLDDNQHISIAKLSPDIAERTVTLWAPSKTFNMPSLGFSAAITQNSQLRQAMDNAARGIVPHVNVLGYAAAAAAYTQCDDWHRALVQYLIQSRDYVVRFIDEQLPGISTTCPEATYLAWLDCSQAGIGGDPHEFFLKEAKVGFSDGPAFGPGGENFVRMNFGCPRSTLTEALERMKAALEKLG